MTKSLYQDFTLTEDNCDAEPIHRPLAIDGGGHLLAFELDSWKLVAASQGAAALFGLPTNRLWGEPVETWLPPTLLAELHSGETDPKVPPPKLDDSGLSFDIIVHRHQGIAFLELEERTQDDANPAELLQLGRLFSQCNNEKTLAEEACRFIRTVFGFDRVMVYRFDEDHHGYVLGEAKCDLLEPFLGLHYPATDIPKIARDLFLLNRTRIISDVELPNRWLEFNPQHPLAHQHLDLSRTQLRATSPIHIEYLVNMGVQATCTVAIVVDNALWGLFACHHYSPFKPTYSSRVMAELASQQFVGRLLAFSYLQKQETLKKSLEKEAVFLHSISLDEQYQLQAFGGSTALMSLCECSGAAIVTRGIEPATIGSVPPSTALLKLRDYMLENGQKRLASYKVAADFPDVELNTDKFGGVLAIRVSEASDTVLFWFRAPKRHVITWAGDQRLPNQTVHKNTDNSIRLSPRSSFEKWQQAIGDQSERWESSALDMVDRLRNQLLSKEMDRTATLVERNSKEFMEMTFAVAHDLKEPLRTQLSYFDLLEEEFSEDFSSNANHYLNRSRVAVQRMQDLTADLMEYTNLNREPVWVRVDVGELLDEVIDSMGVLIASVEATVEHNVSVVLMVDRNCLAQVLRNFLSNALKYVPADRQPQIQVSCTLSDEAVEIHCTDNGIGIAAEDQEKIFELYKRLHHRKDYDGTGVGLSIAKRAIETIGGTIGVHSTPDQGSTFWMRLNRNLVTT